MSFKLVFIEKYCRKCGAKFRTSNKQKSCCSRKCSYEWGLIKKYAPIRDMYEIMKLHKKTPQEIHYNRYKKAAHRRSIDFHISRNVFDSFWGKPCHYCGSEIKTIGIDRVDNSLGYIPDNIVPCCKVCNWMKGDRSKNEFIDSCLRIALIHSKTVEIYNENLKNYGS